jgi:GH43 family beta-xylosidase
MSTPEKQSITPTASSALSVSRESLSPRANGVFGPGRATFTMSPDGKQDWIVYHAKTTDDYVYDGRETRAQEFTWNADGTPNFGMPASVNTALTPPSGEK